MIERDKVDALVEHKLDLTYGKEELIHYKYKTKEYGRAEFTVCSKWISGRVRKIYIYRAQQESTKEFYTADVNSDCITPVSWTYKGVDNPWAWRYVWCKEHKCMAINFYVPDHTSSLRVRSLSSLQLIFE